MDKLGPRCFLRRQGPLARKFRLLEGKKCAKLWPGSYEQLNQIDRPGPGEVQTGLVLIDCLPFEMHITAITFASYFVIMFSFLFWVLFFLDSTPLPAPAKQAPRGRCVRRAMAVCASKHISAI